MNAYKVTLNGKVYEFTIELINKDDIKTAPAAAPAPAKAAPAGNAGATAVKAPMPGTLIKVNVKPGDAVKKGDVLCVLEAMKMENDIMAPADGVVATVEAAQGSSVATDAVLVTLN